MKIRKFQIKTKRSSKDGEYILTYCSMVALFKMWISYYLVLKGRFYQTSIKLGIKLILLYDTKYWTNKKIL